MKQLFCLVTAAYLMGAQGFGQGDLQPEPVPSGYDFPAEEAALVKLRDQQDRQGMRNHAWLVFAGMTQKAHGGEAIWETWWPSWEVMAAGPLPQGPRKLRKVFQIPRQFRGLGGQATPQAIGASLAEFVLFNDVAKKHIRSNGLNLRTNLNRLNSMWPSSTPLDKRKVADFPREAMSIKTAWFLVKQTGLTAMPIWDEQERKNLYPELPPETWPRTVAVDPSRTSVPAGETATVARDGRNFPNSKVVPLSSFYSFRLDQTTVDQLRTAMIFGDQPEVGDYLALVNLHFTTKEIPDWVWATLWWHDQPDQSPYGSDRPSQVEGVWRNYKMDVSFSMETPKESDGTPNVVFNPWLEARFENGANSNCMTCHQRAVWPRRSFLPVTRGAMSENDPYFKGSTKLDFLWSIALESKP